ncbi:ExeA family protein [Calycomorphotria hydatis]|uniref:ATPase family associated with various cellular activities (AAA) n=1 Tax=Calycomorphotria hydatis TaxID=2528027 RepID=A0A517TC80_9PLAN|nr:AAA family ATPase [Calycomorphotria hydatis]QDT65974.1 ATPase family associated with various cellular activities (AAA) [Calycomorphotria hydatis]
MYESFFDLECRPFTAAPDGRCVIPVDIFTTAHDQLEQSIRNGHTLSVLTGPIGAGKTLLCRQLRQTLQSKYRVLYLAGADYPSKRSLLQAIVYELGRPYARMSEQELRFEFETAMKEMSADIDSLLIVIDDAHRLSDRILQELLQLIVGSEHQSECRVQLLLAGQLSLEEVLSKPCHSELNNRTGCHVTLGRLSRAESMRYVSERIKWAGGHAANVFDEEALDLLAHVSDGNPRCLNQLADHCLLLAFVAEESCVERKTVLDALEDLRRLPLHWNEPVATEVPTTDRSAMNSTKDFTFDTEEEDAAVFEVGAQIDEEEFHEPTSDQHPQLNKSLDEMLRQQADVAAEKQQQYEEIKEADWDDMPVAPVETTTPVAETPSSEVDEEIEDAFAEFEFEPDAAEVTETLPVAPLEKVSAEAELPVEEVTIEITEEFEMLSVDHSDLEHGPPGTVEIIAPSEEIDSIAESILDDMDDLEDYVAKTDSAIISGKSSDELAEDVLAENSETVEWSEVVQVYDRYSALDATLASRMWAQANSTTATQAESMLETVDKMAELIDEELGNDVSAPTISVRLDTVIDGKKKTSANNSQEPDGAQAGLFARLRRHTAKRA